MRGFGFWAMTAVAGAMLLTLFAFLGQAIMATILDIQNPPNAVIGGLGLVVLPVLFVPLLIVGLIFWRTFRSSR